ncbi:MAG: adenosylcobalamin-dependent ribonucleoside-diphosphate reductase [Methanolinea sp.]|nr:adenosylcobalamin-dependent ribonucleoside-diphosphate reductase [Methanolinea sp.]
MELCEPARVLLASRYLLPGETPEDMFRRVANAVGTDKKDLFAKMMGELRFLPNSPTLMNANTACGQLSACFVLPVEDSIDQIFSVLRYMAMIHKSGGGTGFSFSRVRPRGDSVGGWSGVASGPLSFIRVYDEATNALRQGGKRRGANMGVLSSHHPDIVEFIRAKEGGGLQNFNLSVGFDADFFAHLERGSRYPLVNPRDGSVWEEIDPRLLFETLSLAAWRCGDPGVLFLDRINEKNPVPGLGEIEATNPCGEQPLLPWESCNLGSINLSRCMGKGDIDWELLRETTWLAVEFLDAVIDVNRFPLAIIRDHTMRTRKIGLGVMGFADMLIRLEVPYQSQEALNLAERLMRFIEEESHAASRALGEEKGSFPAIDKSVYTGPMRNATVTTIAPTGSLHLIACTSSGIEPLFACAGERVINGRRFSIVHPELKRHFLGLPNGGELLAEAKRRGSLEGLLLPPGVKELFRNAAEIDPDFHVRMQATFQKHVDNAVSKTVNLPQGATPEEIAGIFLLARRLGCKGITVYRYKSKEDQVLSRGCDACRVDTLVT